MARYKEYEDLPAHVQAMLIAVTSDADAAERFAHAPNKHLKGRSVMEIINVWFGQRVVERYLLDLGNYLGVDDMDRFEAEFGKRR